jgi:glycosyltransferase involved in cell wall biosynthesis
MHILYIHQHFTTNAGASGTRSYDYARYLVGAGHRVTVVTGVYALGPFVQPGGSLIQTCWIDGIRVMVINVRYTNQMTFLQRTASFLLFAVLSVVACLRSGRVDVVLATSTPLTVGIPALAMRWLRGVPYVFEVRDLWPSFAVSMGVLTNPLLIRLARWAERLFYRHAARVQTISHGLVEALVQEGLDRSKLTMIPTGVDLELYRNVQPDSSLRRQAQWQDRVVAVYAGAHSDANNLEYVVEAARLLRDDPRVGFLMIGEGRTRERLVKLAKEYGLLNILFHPRLPKQTLAGVLCDADVGLVILQPLAEFAAAMPNKLFDYLAAGLAVVVNFSGEAQWQLKTTGAGRATDSRDPADLSRALAHWADNPQELLAAKQAARELARRYDRKVWAGRLERILCDVAAQG